MTKPHLSDLIAELSNIHASCIAMEKAFAPEIAATHGNYHESARNLLHYLGFRQHDLREIQVKLSALGLSSLGRMEAHTLAGLDAVLCALRALAGKKAWPRPPAEPGVDFVSGPALLSEHANQLLGLAVERKARIMVSMAREAGEQYTVIRDLMAAGMDVMRVNCAHDDESVWMGMISNLRRAEREVGRSCRILMDLGGPKLRTGALSGGPQVMRWKTVKGRRGEAIAPSRIRIFASDNKNVEETVFLTVEPSVFETAERGDHLDLHLPGGRIRKLRIVQKEEGSCWAECLHSGYGETGMRVTLRHKHKVKAKGTIGELPRLEDPLLLKCGDTLIVTGPGGPAERRLAAADPVRIPCTLPQVFPFVK